MIKCDYWNYDTENMDGGRECRKEASYFYSISTQINSIIHARCNAHRSKPEFYEISREEYIIKSVHD